MKKKQLKRSYLYVIFDHQVLKEKDLFSIIKQLIKGGADIIQWRDKISGTAESLKKAKELRSLAREKDVLFIVNDRVDIAKAVDSDGVHLGREDLPIREARKILGKDKIIGLSCHSLKDVLLAKRANADYISIGPVFKTPLKPKAEPINLSLFKDLEEKIKIPVFAIGGINYKNLSMVLKMGIKRVAICRGILLSKDIYQQTKRIKKVLKNLQN